MRRFMAVVVSSAFWNSLMFCLVSQERAHLLNSGFVGVFPQISLKGPKIEKIQGRPPGLRCSSEIPPPNPILWRILKVKSEFSSEIFA